MSDHPTSTQPDPELPEVTLGVHGTIRLKVAPRITLEAGSAKAALKTLKSDASFVIKGGGKNLTPGHNIPCTLEWLIQTDRVGAESPRLVPHPRKALVVPSGGGFELKEMGGDETKVLPLTFDAIEMGVLGTGKLGYIITLDVIGMPEQDCVMSDGKQRAHPQCSKHHLVVLPASSTIDVELPVPIRVKPQPVGVLGTEVFGSVLMGTLVNLSWEPLAAGGQPCWVDNCKVTVELAEYARASGETKHWEMIPKTDVRFDLSNPADKGAMSFRIGSQTPLEDAPGPWGPPVFRYHHARSQAQHNFGWRVVVSRTSPAQKDKKHDPEVVSDPVLFATGIAHPSLTSLEIGTDWRKSELWVKASFDGFDPGVVLSGHVDLYAIVRESRSQAGAIPQAEVCVAPEPLTSLLPEAPRTPDAPLDMGEKGIYPITKLLPAELPTESFSTPVRMAHKPLKGLHFLARVLPLNKTHNGLSLHDALKRDHPEMHLFAAVSFDPAQFGAQTAVIFHDCAHYTANTDQDRHAGGHAPFYNGVFVHEVSAPSVCTRQIDLHGDITELAGTVRLPFVPNSKAVEAFRQGAWMKSRVENRPYPGLLYNTYHDVLTRKLSSEAEERENSGARAKALKTLAEDYGFGDRFAMYRAVQEITNVSWEIVAVLHLLESSADAAPMHAESGFGLDRQDDAVCNRRLQKYGASPLRTKYPALTKPFGRGGRGHPADIFQAAVVAAEYYRENLVDGLKTYHLNVKNEGERSQKIMELFRGFESSPASVSCDLSRMSSHVIAFGAVAYNAGPFGALAKRALLEGRGYLFDLGDDDPRVLFPGGTSLSIDGGSRIVVPPGRKDGLVRWDVLLDAVEVWSAERNRV